MKDECDVIRDLLPLYADDACSAKSRELVREHLLDCAECRAVLLNLQKNEIEDRLKSEKRDVIKYGEKRFKRRSATVGSVISGIFMIPILVCLIVNRASGHSLDWFFIVLASLCVAASLIIVPLMASEDKAFWTLCSFTASLMLLLAVTCVYSRGNWFFIAAGASLFGLSVVFLPFAIRARPLQKVTGGRNKTLIVLGTDAILFANMMAMIFARGRLTLSTGLFTAVIIACAGWIVKELPWKKEEK